MKGQAKLTLNKSRFISKLKKSSEKITTRVCTLMKNIHNKYKVKLNLFYNLRLNYLTINRTTF